MNCPFCSQALEAKVRFRSICSSCDRDLHCCVGCTFYDESKPYQCKRVDIEPVRDKVKANFCEYFSLAQKPAQKKKPKDPTASFLSLFKDSTS